MSAVFLDFATVGAADLDPAALQAELPDLRIHDTTTPAQVVERIRDAEFVLTNKVRLTAEVLAQARRLRFIGLTATGHDNVDIAAAREGDIAVCNIRGYCTQSVVEHVFGVLLQLAHSLGRFHAAVQDGAWQASQEFCMLDFPLHQLSAMTVGIVGHGELGAGVRRTAEHFGMPVLIARRAGAAATDDGRVALDDLLAAADVVSLHCPLTPDTADLIGARELGLMKKTAFLINTARGGLVDSAALVAALEAGHIGGAAIDVLPEEPPVNGNPLLDCRSPNLIVTPHIAWATLEARQTALAEVARNLAAFKAGERRNRIV